MGQRMNSHFDEEENGMRQGDDRLKIVYPVPRSAVAPIGVTKA